LLSPPSRFKPLPPRSLPSSPFNWAAQSPPTFACVRSRTAAQQKTSMFDSIWLDDTISKNLCSVSFPESDACGIPFCKLPFSLQCIYGPFGGGGHLFSRLPSSCAPRSPHAVETFLFGLIFFPPLRFRAPRTLETLLSPSEWASSPSSRVFLVSILCPPSLQDAGSFLPLTTVDDGIRLSDFIPPAVFASSALPMQGLVLQRRPISYSSPFQTILRMRFLFWRDSSSRTNVNYCRLDFRLSP